MAPAYDAGMSRPCHVVRVFTRGDEGGNHLGVINDVIGITDEQMQRTATDLGFSETVFIDWTDATVDPLVRIFTPEEELPFAGHPLVGSAWVMTRLGPGGTGRFRTGVGSVQYSVTDDVVSVSSAIDIEVIGHDDVAEVAVGADMPEPIATVRLGLPKEYGLAEYSTFDDIASLSPNMDALMGRFGFYAFAREGTTVKARFFAPGTAVPEDPATGSAAVALARAFLLRGEDEGAVTVLQGDEIGHPCSIQLRWVGDSTIIGGTVRRDEVRLLR